jgi:hypothetical protein
MVSFGRSGGGSRSGLGLPGIQADACFVYILSVPLHSIG